MLKVILIFIKSHIVIATITTTIVVGTVVATPIIVDNYKKEKDAKQNISSNDSVTASSNQTTTDNTVISNDTETINNAIINGSTEVSDNKITNNNSIANDNSTTSDKPTTSNNSTSNENKPLTFRIEKIEREDEGVGKGIEYKVVPSYNKDGSKWTEEEKAEYERMLQEAAKMSKADYDEAVEREKQIMEEISKSLEQN